MLYPGQCGFQKPACRRDGCLEKRIAATTVEPMGWCNKWVVLVCHHPRQSTCLSTWAMRACKLLSRLCCFIHEKSNTPQNRHISSKQTVAHPLPATNSSTTLHTLFAAVVLVLPTPLFSLGLPLFLSLSLFCRSVFVCRSNKSTRYFRSRHPPR